MSYAHENTLSRPRMASLQPWLQLMIHRGAGTLGAFVKWCVIRNLRSGKALLKFMFVGPPWRIWMTRHLSKYEGVPTSISTKHSYFDWRRTGSETFGIGSWDKLSKRTNVFLSRDWTLFVSCYSFTKAVQSRERKAPSFRRLIFGPMPEVPLDENYK